jgi:hypothetical protein
MGRVLFVIRVCAENRKLPSKSCMSGSLRVNGTHFKRAQFFIGHSNLKELRTPPG